MDWGFVFSNIFLCTPPMKKNRFCSPHNRVSYLDILYTQLLNGSTTSLVFQFLQFSNPFFVPFFF